MIFYTWPGRGHQDNPTDPGGSSASTQSAGDNLTANLGSNLHVFVSRASIPFHIFLGLAKILYYKLYSYRKIQR
jgi:hypothetical protein